MTNKFVFNLEQKPVSKRKSACNESCRSSNKELRSIEFAFFLFFDEFLGIFKVCYFEFMAFLLLDPWSFGSFSG